MSVSIEITTSEPEQSDGCYWSYDMQISVGDDVYEVRCWKIATFLERGADQDIDGSGLKLYGNSQPGGWRCLDSDGQSRGNPTPSWTATGRILVANTSESTLVRVPDGESPEGFFDALEAALKDAVEEVEVPEPDAEEVFEELGTICEVGDTPWLRVGCPYDSKQVYCAWEDDENGEFAMEDISSDEEIPHRVKELAASKFAEIFSRAFHEVTV